MVKNVRTKFDSKQNQSPVILRAGRSNANSHKARETSLFKAPCAGRIPVRHTNIKRLSGGINSRPSQYGPKKLNNKQNVVSKSMFGSNIAIMPYRASQFFPNDGRVRPSANNIIQNLMQRAESLLEKNQKDNSKVHLTVPSTPKVQNKPVVKLSPWTRSCQINAQNLEILRRNPSSQVITNMVSSNVAPPSTRKVIARLESSRKEIAEKTLVFDQPNSKQSKTTENSFNSVNGTETLKANVNLNNTTSILNSTSNNESMGQQEIVPSRTENSGKENADHSCGLSQIQKHCQMYRVKEMSINQCMKNLDASFECLLKNEAENQIFEKFCIYQARKDDLYREMKQLEDKLEGDIKREVDAKASFSSYIQRKEDIFKQKASLHKEFEETVCNILDNCSIKSPQKDEEYEKENEQKEQEQEHKEQKEPEELKGKKSSVPIVQKNSREIKCRSSEKQLGMTESLIISPKPTLRRSVRLIKTPVKFPAEITTPISRKGRESSDRSILRSMERKSRNSASRKIKSSIYKDLQRSFHLCSPSTVDEDVNYVNSARRELGRKIQKQIDELFDD